MTSPDSLLSEILLGILDWDVKYGYAHPLARMRYEPEYSSRRIGESGIILLRTIGIMRVAIQFPVLINVPEHDVSARFQVFQDLRVTDSEFPLPVSH
jgi:hypothetical protein